MKLKLLDKATLKEYYEKFCKDLKYKSLRKKDELVLDEDLNTKDLQINVERTSKIER